MSFFSLSLPSLLSLSLPPLLSLVLSKTTMPPPDPPKAGKDAGTGAAPEDPAAPSKLAVAGGKIK